MRIVLIGCSGQLGTDLKEELSVGHKDYEVFCPRVDITNYRETNQKISTISPDIIINTAAYHKESCRKAFEVNAFAAGNLAELSSDLGARIVYISTGDVFSEPGEHFENSRPNPITNYGLSKYLGEQFIKKHAKNYYIIRTAGLYGIRGCAGKNYKNFPKVMLGRCREGKSLKVKDDEYISPTYTRDLAKAIQYIILRENYGLYHLVNEGRISWYEFAKEIFKLADLNPDLTPVSTENFGKFRSRDGSLASNKVKLRPWREALGKYLYEELLAQ